MLRPVFFIFVSFLALLFSGCNHFIPPPSPDFCSSCQFLFSTTTTGQILVFKSNGITGLSAPVSVPGPANSPGISTFFTSSASSLGLFLFAADPQNKSLNVFSLSLTDGLPSPLSQSPLSISGTSSVPLSLTASEAGPASALFVGNSNNSIDVFTTTISGALSKVSGSPFPAGASPSHLFPFITTGATSTSNFLAASNFSSTDGSISIFSVDPQTAALAPVSGSPFPTSPNSGPSGLLTVGNFLYVALKNTNSIGTFSTSHSGALSPVSGSPFPAGQGPVSLAVSNHFLYALNAVDNSISTFSIDLTTGVLTPLPGPPLLVGHASGEMLLLNGFLYVSDAQSNAVFVFSVDPSSGLLSPLAGSPFSATSSPLALSAIGFPASDKQ